MRQPDAKKHFQTLKGENPGGLSYKELSVGSNLRENMFPRYAADTADANQFERARSDKPAGAPSIRTVKGSGSFQFETTWHIEMGNGSDQNANSRSLTETRYSYKPPPEGYKTAASKVEPNTSQIESLGLDQGDYRTTNNVDFDPDYLSKAEVRGAWKPASNYNVIQGTYSPSKGFRTSQQLHHSVEVLSSETNNTRCGNINTRPCGYNIITGGEPLYNNRFEQFQRERDYARKRS
ncbi:hypothetical protein HOP50_01g06590 [Chloropicon primus]|uniref:Uncharacterized protein n=1 Tax=Chloropicon primus TaxID=1764295 RepID=A0A5B8MCE9_9CHLO|nr:hypothetical protein A3770_01p06740 [Chloropicon primus]UPQ97368.1 hypothetical protein HOP50_01g06590 [Chloropicon primus]|eukprot:QDZ18156.1 hypothetical protein A3770_01p06740 [Chloropicon primus]